MFYDGVCLKDPRGQLIRVLVSKRNKFEYCDVTVWHYRVKWRHRWCHLSTRRRHFPMGHEPL